MRTNVESIVVTINHRANATRKGDADSAREKIQRASGRKASARDALKAKQAKAEKLEEDARNVSPWGRLWNKDEKIARDQVRNGKEMQVVQREAAKAAEEIGELHEDLKDVHEDFNDTKQLMNELLDEAATHLSNVAS